MSTPMLRSLRNHNPLARITFYGNQTTQAVLSPSPFCDDWFTPKKKCPLALARQLRKKRFNRVVLCKNSLGAALTCWMAGIPIRVGYAREGRTILLTERLYPPRHPSGRFRALPMIDYYLALSHWLGADVTNRHLELSVDRNAVTRLHEMLPSINDISSPLVILVPGGAFGPSKCWPVERFAQVAETLCVKHQARVVLSVAPIPEEQQIAASIVAQCPLPLINLAEYPMDLAILKALYAQADLVITNDTGPRHIAIALQRKVITLFGPNDPAWTQTGWEHETQIVGRAPCVPCQKPTCQAERHFCMESISVSEVLEAVDSMLETSDPTDRPDQSDPTDQIS